MALSAITGITLEGWPEELATFTRGGVVYVLWVSPIPAPALSRLHWKPHNGLDYTEVSSQAYAFRNVAAILDPVSDELVVVWDDGLGEDRVRNGSLYYARLNVLTGEYAVPPTQLFEGAGPALSYLTAQPDQRFMLYYRTPKTLGVYGRISDDGGAAWESGYPLVTGRVSRTQAVEVVPYDASRMSLAQLGDGAKELLEVSLLQRTRPISSVMLHPTDPGKVYIGETSRRTDASTVDTLRGRLVFSVDETLLYHLDGTVTGTSDGVNAVALVTVSNDLPVVSASAGPNGDGDNLSAYSLTPTYVNTAEMPGAAGVAVDADVSATYGYVALYADDATAGELVVVTLSSYAVTSVLSGITAVRAVAVANFLSPPLIFAATTESAVQRLRVYQENGTSPTLLLNVVLPSSVNGMTVEAHPSISGAVRLFIGMTDRIGVYDYTTSVDPLQLFDAWHLTSAQYGGRAFKPRRASNGSTVVPLGNAGVALYDADFRLRAVTRLSALPVQRWTPSTSYTLGALVRPRDTHEFADTRYYFRATVGGTSASAEPRWVSSGTFTDGTVTWTKQELTDGVAVDVALDETAKRIYVAGVAGGATGTNGRLWILDARGLI